MVDFPARFHLRHRLIPIVVNSLFNLIPMAPVISQYFSEIAVLLLGSDLICLTWTTTGLTNGFP